MLTIWVQCCGRELAHSLVTLQREHKVGDRGWAEWSQKKGWSPPDTFLGSGAAQRHYRARTCKLKSNGTKALQHLPPYAQNRMWQDSRWCTNVRRICLDPFLRWIPQAAFKLRKAQVRYNTKLRCLCSWMETTQKCWWGCLTTKGTAKEKGKGVAGIVSIQSNLCWVFFQVPVRLQLSLNWVPVGNIPPTTSQCLNSRGFFLEKTFWF